MDLRNIEFFGCPNTHHIIIHNLNTHKLQYLSAESIEITDQVYDELKENYTICFKRLQNIYRMKAGFKRLMVSRFLRCNFYNNDNQPDIDNKGRFVFEEVTCPLKNGYCKDEGIICKPERNSGLTKREKEVAGMFVEGQSKEQIASRLFLSIHTVENHIRHIYSKTSVNSRVQLIHVAHLYNF